MAGCFELFGTRRVNAIRDLKGKAVAVPALGSAHHNFIASMAAYVGVDAIREISFVTHPVGESARLLAEEKVDALMGFPPVPQELRQKKIGHVIVNSGIGRPSQYFCCIVAATVSLSSASGGDEAGTAGDREGDEPVCRRTRAGRSPSGGQRLPITIHAADNERDSLRAMAGLRSRRLPCASTPCACAKQG